jgi:hypothetical protein
MYIRSLFEANKHIRDPRQQRVGLPDALMLDLELTFGLSGVIPRGRGPAREMEAPRSIPSANRAWRFVGDRSSDIPSTMLTMLN